MKPHSLPQLVVLGEDWGQHPSSTQHLIKRLLPDYQVLWVNSIGMRCPRFTLHDLTRIVRKLGAVLRGARHAGGQSVAPSEVSSPRVLPPLALPLPGSRLAGKINGTGWRRRSGASCPSWIAPCSGSPCPAPSI